MGIALKPCKSSQIEGFGYDAGTQTLAVKFKSGDLYRYSGVPPEIHEEMGKAESVGKFLGQKIKGAFEFERVTEKD